MAPVTDTSAPIETADPELSEGTQNLDESYSKPNVAQDAGGAEVEYWEVVIESTDDLRPRMIPVPVKITMKEVKEIYACVINADPNNINFLTHNGDRVDDNQIVMLMEKVNPDVDVIKLTAEDKTEKKDSAVRTSVSRAESVGTDALHELVPIHVVLTGRRSIRLEVRPHDTLGSIVDLLRRCRLLMGVKEVRVGDSGTLSAQPGWRQRSMRECGVGPGMELFLDAFMSRMVLIAVYDGPTNQGVVCRTVGVPKAGADWTVVQRGIQRHCPTPFDESTLVAQRSTVCLRDGCLRRNVESFDNKERRFVSADEDDCQHDDQLERYHTLLEVMKPGSGIIAAPGYYPVLVVYLNTTTFTICEDGQLVPAPRHILFDPRSVIFMVGIYLRRDDGGCGAFMVRMADDSFADTYDGSVYDNEEATINHLCNVPGTWTRALIFGMVGDSLPHWAFPERKALFIRTRQGVTVTVEDGRLTATTDSDSAPLSGSRWVTSVAVSPFDVKISDLIRRK